MLEVVMISTGEEVLHGDITDTNAAWLSRLFFEQGFAVTRRTTVGDQLERLAKEIEHCSLTADIVIVNGGLGPTTDDLTAQAAAIAGDVGLELSDVWVSAMQEKYAQLGREMPPTNIKQAMLPSGAELLDNPIGTACGFAMRMNRAWVFFTPGVPREFKQMTHEQILPRLAATYTANQTARDCLRLYTFGLSESGIGHTLQDLVLPEGFELGYRSSLPFIEVKLFVPEGHAQADTLYQQIADRLGDNIVGRGQPLLAALDRALSASGQTLAVAECYTGGAVINTLYEAGLGQALAQSWVMRAFPDNGSCEVKGKAQGIAQNAQPSEANCVCTSGETNNPAAAMALNALSQNAASVVLAIGEANDEQHITLTLAVADGLGEPSCLWSQTVSTRRQYAYRDHRTVIATLALDMLRRYLNKQPVFGQYESLMVHETRQWPQA